MQIRLQPLVAGLALVGLFAISVLIGYVAGLAFLAPSAPAPARSVRPAPLAGEQAQTPAPTPQPETKPPAATPPAPTPPTEPATPATQSAQQVGAVLYRVQVGAYVSKENAESRAAKLRDAGFDAYVTQGGSLYIVQVGAFAVRENAERLADQLRAAGYKVIITH